VSASDGSIGFIGLIIAGAVLWYGFVRDSDSLAKSHAQSQYGVPNSKIQIAGKRPHDCEFMTAPLGEKHCFYEREYRAEWVTLSTTNDPIVYGTDQESQPISCSSSETDFAHRCYPVNGLKPNEHLTAGWHARSVEIHWRKVEE
jgi:hypothetical protein